MSKKAIIYIVLLVLAVAVIIIKKSTDNDVRKKSGTSAEMQRNGGFDRRISLLKYTQHATCRMECRKISQDEVEDIMEQGKINYHKSNLKDDRCPTYALEGMTIDKQRVRIVFGQCDNFTNVVTVIDLDTDWECNCRGDEKTYENNN